MVDCSKDGCWGCDGGWPDNAMKYLKANGATDQETYPYTAEDGVCSYDRSRKFNLQLDKTFFYYINGNNLDNRQGQVQVVPLKKVSFSSR